MSSKGDKPALEALFEVPSGELEMQAQETDVLRGGSDEPLVPHPLLREATQQSDSFSSFLDGFLPSFSGIFDLLPPLNDVPDTLLDLAAVKEPLNEGSHDLQETPDFSLPSPCSALREGDDAPTSAEYPFRLLDMPASAQTFDLTDLVRADFPREALDALLPFEPSDWVLSAPDEAFLEPPLCDERDYQTLQLTPPTYTLPSSPTCPSFYLWLGISRVLAPAT